MDYRDKTNPRVEPSKSSGVTERVTTGCGYLYIAVNRDSLGPCGVILSLGRANGCCSSMLEAIQNLVTTSLLAGVSFKAIIEALKNIRCSSVTCENGRTIFSCADAIASVLKRRLLEEVENE